MILFLVERKGQSEREDKGRKKRETTDTGGEGLRSVEARLCKNDLTLR